ncbi:hypothetical protein WT81_22470 [Burkholderia stagnalis]|uniref:hypothetical protein n=1 Tax=Burkholderia stagnalis TaxID=1503054 RepID=UPI00075FA4F7|nr:hypothetical protein [Burkholderia stagnalis]KWK40796.1 hypothetical protein WT80_26395 [Burkholderia stagnalis]KWK54240.1 hypothetical protein WT81_22470 [Burkholderia stagnalis]
MSKQLTVRYPFEGHPAPLQVVGLFSFLPDAYLKLFGMSVQASFDDAGLGHLYRRLTRKTQNPRNEKRIMKTLGELLSKLEAPGGPPAFLADLKLAIDGCEQAKQRIDNLTFVETALLSFGTKPHSWQRRHSHLVLLERSGRYAQHLFATGDSSGAVDYISAHPLLKALLWPEAVEALHKASDMDALRPLTSAMSLDAHLGWLAAWDLDSAEKRGLPAPQFANLIPSKTQPGRNPTSLLFDELKRRLGVTSVADVLDKGQSVPDVEIGTLYRWSSGKNFPDTGTVSALMAAHGLDKDPEDILYQQYGAAKVVNLIAYMCQTIATKTREHGEPSAFWPWPAYPFGHSDFESWAAARYPFWLDFQRENGAALTKLARTAHGTKIL